MLNAPTIIKAMFGPKLWTSMLPMGAVASGHSAMHASEMPFAMPRLSGYHLVVKASDRLYMMPSAMPTITPNVRNSMLSFVANPVRIHPMPKIVPAMIMIL